VQFCARSCWTAFTASDDDAYHIGKSDNRLRIAAGRTIVGGMQKLLILIFSAALTICCMATPATAAISCTLSMTNINFGSVNVLSGAAVNATGTATITCSGASSNTSYVFCTNIRSGTDASGNQRRMASGSNDVNFDLYQNAAHTTEWGSYSNNFLGGGNQSSFTSNGSGNISGTITVYAVLDGSQQTAVPGSYSESMSGGSSNELQYGSTSGTCPTGSSTSQYSFTVSATLTTACNVSAGTLNFGSTLASIASAIDSTASITAQCTNTTPYSIGLGNGVNASGSQRRMRLGATGNYINYNLYTDSGYSHPWTTTTSTTSCTGGSSTCDLGTGTGSNQNYTVYGQVPAQFVPVTGTFSDTVVVTATF
jgi:spore coat protein U-like protein